MDNNTKIKVKICAFLCRRLRRWGQRPPEEHRMKFFRAYPWNLGRQIAQKYYGQEADFWRRRWEGHTCPVRNCHFTFPMSDGTMALLMAGTRGDAVI